MNERCVGHLIYGLKVKKVKNQWYIKCIKQWLLVPLSALAALKVL